MKVPIEEYPTIVRRYTVDRDGLDTIAVDYGVVRNTVKRILIHEGVDIRHKGEWAKGQPTGSASHHWKGGRWITAQGYAVVWADPEHPFYDSMSFQIGQTNGSRYFREHRIVMADHLGRPLMDHETVHHKNGIRDDNRINNLQLRVGAHGSGQRYQCAHCGSHDLIPLELG